MEFTLPSFPGGYYQSYRYVFFRHHDLGVQASKGALPGLQDALADTSVNLTWRVGEVLSVFCPRLILKGRTYIYISIYLPIYLSIYLSYLSVCVWILYIYYRYSIYLYWYTPPQSNLYYTTQSSPRHASDLPGSGCSRLLATPPLSVHGLKHHWLVVSHQRGGPPFAKLVERSRVCVSFIVDIWLTFWKLTSFGDYSD